MKRRRGASLIELLIVISVGSVMMMLTGTMIHRLFQSEQVSARSALVEVTTSRLADQFRRDIHAAGSIDQVTAVDLQLNLPGTDSRKVHYTVAPGKVHRTVTVDKATLSHDTFRLPDCQADYRVPKAPAAAADGPSPRIVSLVIRRPHATVATSAQAVRPLWELQVDAELGRDQRLVDSKPIASKESP